MKITRLPLLFTAMSVTCTFAATNITVDTDYAAGTTLTDDIIVSNNATLSALGNLTTGNYGMKIEAGSTLLFNTASSSEFKTTSANLTTPSVFDIYGTIDRASGSNAVNWIISDQSSHNTVVNFYDGSKLSNTGGPINFEVRRGTATINVLKGAEVKSNDINLGGRDDGNINATINIQGKADFGAWVRLGNTGLKDGYAGIANLNVTNGGTLTARDFVTNNGTGYAASVVLKDLGSSISVTYAVVLGKTVDDRSTSKLTVFTGANFKVNNGNSLTSNSVNKVVFGLDSNISSAVDTALFSISKLIVNTANSEKTFSFDTSTLGAVQGLSDGDVVKVTLFENLTSITLNGVEHILSSMDNAQLQALLADFIDFNFAGNDYWAAADIADITKEGNNIVLSMTYAPIPEPAMFAAIFGALALALAAYRRRR